MNEASPPHPLDRWLAERRRTRSWLASQLGISEASLSRIIGGKQWGGREFFQRVAKVTKGDVTANDFLPQPARAS